MSSTAADDANVVRVRGSYDGTNSLSVYYEAFGTLFRARLSPVHSGQALELTDLSEVEEDDEDATVLHRFDLSTQVAHVPPVVREAVRRPVQVPVE